jgi:hypothetical protein
LIGPAVGVCPARVVPKLRFPIDQQNQYRTTQSGTPAEVVGQLSRGLSVSRVPSRVRTWFDAPQILSPRRHQDTKVLGFLDFVVKIWSLSGPVPRFRRPVGWEKFPIYQSHLSRLAGDEILVTRRGKFPRRPGPRRAQRVRTGFWSYGYLHHQDTKTPRHQGLRTSPCLCSSPVPLDNRVRTGF